MLPALAGRQCVTLPRERSGRWQAAGVGRSGAGRRRSHGDAARNAAPAQLLAVPEQDVWQHARPGSSSSDEDEDGMSAAPHTAPVLASKPMWVRSSGSGSDIEGSGADSGGSGSDSGSDSSVAWRQRASKNTEGRQEPPNGRAGGGGASAARRAAARGEEEEAVVVAGRRYASSLELRNAMRHLQRSLLGDADEAEVLPGSEEFAVLQALFRRHPSYAQKVREPIQRFFVVRNPYVAGGAGCEFQYEDARGPQARADFSLLKCTRVGVAKKRRNSLLEACSHAVEEQLAGVLARAERGPGGARLCSRCGSDFKVEAAYVEHQTMSKLVQAYKEAGAPGRAPSKFDLVPRSQQAAFRLFSSEDAAWRNGWVVYHQQHAKLVPLCKQCQCKQAEARRAAERRHAGGPGLPGPWDRRQGRQAPQHSQLRFSRG